VTNLEGVGRARGFIAQRVSRIMPFEIAVTLPGRQAQGEPALHGRPHPQRG